MSHRLAIVFPVLLFAHSLNFGKKIHITRCDLVKSKITIASTISSPHHPTTIFIHGLDSSKETWSGVMNELTSSGYPAIAIDLRGHGESPFGEIKEEDFTSKMLSDDIRIFIEDLRLDKPVVIVGHSMGGRILIDLLSNEIKSIRNGGVKLISASVIEDIDVQTREGPASVDSEQQQQLESFSEQKGGRLWENWENFYNFQLACLI